MSIDLGLAAAGRANHQNVLGNDFLTQTLGKLRAPPAVPQRNGDGAFRVILADDVAVEFSDGLGGGEMIDGHGYAAFSSSECRVSIVTE